MAKGYYYYLLRRGAVGTPYNKGVKDFESRVLSDGGSIEAIKCLNSAISALLSINP